MGRIDKSTLDNLLKYFEDVRYSYSRLMKYEHINPEYYERFHTQLGRTESYLHEYIKYIRENIR